MNDLDVSGREGETVLKVAQDNGIFIPRLCHLGGLSDTGACRLCLVEIKGATRPQPACVTRPQEGMEVHTETPRLAAYRRMILELLFIEGNHICSVCVSNGHCELQALAQRLGVDHTRLEYRHPSRSIDASHPRFLFDQHRCILCTRCVRVCDEVEGAHTWDVMGRGIESKVITDLDQPWGESPTCTECSKCINVCPTGALVEKGRAVAENTKRREFLPYLAMMREPRR